MYLGPHPFSGSVRRLPPSLERKVIHEEVFPLFSGLCSELGMTGSAAAGKGCLSSPVETQGGRTR